MLNALSSNNKGCESLKTGTSDELYAAWLCLYSYKKKKGKGEQTRHNEKGEHTNPSKRNILIFANCHLLYCICKHKKSISS